MYFPRITSTFAVSNNGTVNKKFLACFKKIHNRLRVVSAGL